MGCNDQICMLHSLEARFMAVTRVLRQTGTDEACRDASENKICTWMRTNSLTFLDRSLTTISNNFSSVVTNFSILIFLELHSNIIFHTAFIPSTLIWLEYDLSSFTIILLLNIPNVFFILFNRSHLYSHYNMQMIDDGVGAA